MFDRLSEKMDNFIKRTAFEANLIKRQPSNQRLSQNTIVPQEIYSNDIYKKYPFYMDIEGKDEEEKLKINKLKIEVPLV